MKQLIPQSKIDEANLSLNDNMYDEKTHTTEYLDGVEYGFNKGSEFVQNHIVRYATKLIDWIVSRRMRYFKNESGETMWSNHENIECKTNQQLLEEFINSKNEENE